MKKNVGFLQKGIYLYAGIINYKKMNFILKLNIILEYMQSADILTIDF